MDSSKCPICGINAQVQSLPDVIDGYFADCRRCGRYRVPGFSIRAGLGDKNDKNLLPYLSCYTRQTNEQGEAPDINHNNWRNYANAHKGTKTQRQLEKLLEYLAKHSLRGKWAEFDSDLDYPLADAASPEEINLLAEELESKRYIDCQRDRSKIKQILLRVDGWKATEPVAGTGILGRCFVAMSFDETLNDAYELGIRWVFRTIPAGCFARFRPPISEHSGPPCRG